MSKRRLDPIQPDGFKFSGENLKWAKKTIAKYPAGKQRSAVILLLFRAQEQNAGWLSKPAMEYIGEMLDMSFIRVYEVATFYTMFQLSPVGKKAHFQVCGTTPCMLRGSEELIKVCKRKIAQSPQTLSADGDLSWEEVECLGACTNAPMVQVFKDVYEDLSPQDLERIIDDFAAGNTPAPGPQNGRRNSAPIGELTSLTGDGQYNAGKAAKKAKPAVKKATATKVAAGKTAAQKTPAKKTPVKQVVAKKAATQKSAPKKVTAKTGNAATGPLRLNKPDGKADDLKIISGIGPKLEKTLNKLGFWHFAQIAKWGKKDIAVVDDEISFKGRIERDDWVKQAKALAKNGGGKR